VYTIFLGAPGAGKGTQAARAAEELKLAHIASGDMFREALEKQDELATEARSYMEKGMLVPDEITIRMVLERISAPDCEHGVIFDGFPRNLAQAEALDKALAGQAKAIDNVAYIKVSEEELLTRLSGRWICRQCQAPYHAVNSPPRVRGKCDQCGGELYQRSDAQTAPLIDYYTQAGKLLEIDGEGGMDEVGERILEAIGREPVRRREG